MTPDADIGSLAEQSGMDVSRCEFCDKLLDGSKSGKRGPDGAGAPQGCHAGQTHEKRKPGSQAKTGQNAEQRNPHRLHLQSDGGEKRPRPS